MRKTVRRGIATILVAAMVFSLLPIIGNGGTAVAAPAQKTIVGISTTGIKAPKEGNEEDAWTGSFVWFGAYQNIPVKYRVLSPKTTVYGGTTMLLDCDSVLYGTPYDEDMVPNHGTELIDWQYSDLKANMNGKGFLTNPDVFTEQERNAISKSYIDDREANKHKLYPYYKGLTGEKIFLLDYEEATNPQYGYSNTNFLRYVDDDGNILYDCVDYYCKNRAKYAFKKNTKSWWQLRSTVYYYIYNTFTADSWVDSDGEVLDTESEHAFNPRTADYIVGSKVSPAFNVSVSSILFSSVVSGTAGADNAEYKLTLTDKNLKAGITSEKKVQWNGNMVYVPYTVTGANAINISRISVLILDKEYKKGNTNNAKVKYYGKLDTGDNVPVNGAGTFTLPSSLSKSGWNSSYYVYLIAEDENGEHETDYASEPTKITKPVNLGLCITKQPKNSLVIVGETSSFTVVAKGRSDITYHWQTKAPGALLWKNSTNSSATSKTFKIKAQAGHNGYQVRCVIIDAEANIEISNPAVLTVYTDEPPIIIEQPKSCEVWANESASFSVKASGDEPLSYQWQSKENSPKSSWKNVKNSTGKTATYVIRSVHETNVGYKFRCVVTSATGKETVSDEAVLKVLFTNPVFTIEPPSIVHAKVGETVTFHVSAFGNGPIHYQWYVYDYSHWEYGWEYAANTATFEYVVEDEHDRCFRCTAYDDEGHETESKEINLIVDK